MYMYYFLGHRLMQKVKNPAMAKKMAENTFLLALDGDVDFQPSAVQILVDLMRRNSKVGAACGRIHPIGAGGALYLSHTVLIIVTPPVILYLQLLLQIPLKHERERARKFSNIVSATS